MRRFSRKGLTRRRFVAAAAALVAAPPRQVLAQSAPDETTLEAKPRPEPILPAPAPETSIWGFGEPRDAPLLRLKPGIDARLRLVNGLTDPLSLHWQGMRLPNQLDGGAPLTGPPLAPGAESRITIRPPDPGLFWLRPQSAAQLDRGLSGLVIVDEPEPPAIDHEAIARIDDWGLGPDAQLRPPTPGGLQVGDLVTVNARPVPSLRTLRPGARIRLRLLNATRARILVLAFAGVTPKVIAIDGQPCDAFEPVRNTIPAGPGARFDLMLDLPREPGVEVSMILKGAAPPGAAHFPDAPLLSWTTEGDPHEPRPPIQSLPPNEALPDAIRLQSAKRMDLTLDGGPKLDPGLGMALAMGFRPEAPLPAPAPWTINGKPGSLSDRPLFSVRRGTPVSLGFVNRTAMPQAIHVHGHVLRVLHALDDGWEPYWRDTVLVPEGRTSRVAFVADNPGKWVIGSQILDRQAAGLVAWFEVT